MVGVIDMILVFVNVFCIDFVGRGTTYPQVDLVTLWQRAGTLLFLAADRLLKKKSMLHHSGNSICYHIKLSFAEKLFDQNIDSIILFREFAYLYFEALLASYALI